MNIKKEFVIREIVGETILVPVGSKSSSFNGLITINKVAKFIWENLEKIDSEEDMVELIIGKYDVEKSVARKDVEEFFRTLKNVGII